MPDYKVKFEVFEGPLDLLLYLVKKEEVNIYEVSLTNLATQFIEYVDLTRELELELAGEFLVMAATLLYLKSRELLPVELQTQTEDDEEGVDPRWELIRQLVEYKKFKDAATRFQELELQQENVYPRSAPRLEAAGAPLMPEVSLFDLINAVSQVLKRFQTRDDSREIYEDKWTVSEKIEHLLKTCLDRPVIKFSELFADAVSRSEVVVTFLALLELIRLRKLTVTQDESFQEIVISSIQSPSPSTEMASIP